MAATVALAEQWVGTKEQGYNVVPGITDRTGINGQSWCLAFVQVVLADAGWPLPSWWPRTYRCDDLSRAAHRNGATVPLDQGQAGDIIIFSWYPWRYEGSPQEPIIRGDAQYEGWPAGDHVGILTGPLAGGMYPTIEGNTSSGNAGSQDNGDGVYRRRRPLDSVCCIIPGTARSSVSVPSSSGPRALTRMADYSWARPGAAALVSAGYGGVIRYVPGPGFVAASGADIDAAEFAELKAAGLAVALVWQTTGQGASIGMGEAAVAGARQLGYRPGATIFTAVDYDASYAEISAHVDRFVAVVRAAGFTPGVYGGRRVIDGLPDGVIGWQTVAWSGGAVSPKASLYQHLPTTLAGAAIDPNDVLRPFPVDGGVDSLGAAGWAEGEDDVLNDDDKAWLVQVVTDSLANHRQWMLDAVGAMAAAADDDVVALVRDMAATQVATTEALTALNRRVSELAQAAPLRPAPEPPQMHVVATGDTPRSIAAARGVPLALLVSANGLEPGVGLEVGQVLIIPTAAKGVAA